jgi:predicted nucleotidyltransferase
VAKRHHFDMNVLKSYLADVEKICSIEKAFLFGSHARNVASKDSDIDVAIFSKTVNEANRLNLMSELVALVGKYRTDIQPVLFSYDDYLEEDNEFISIEIKGKGIEIFSSELIG